MPSATLRFLSIEEFTRKCDNCSVNCAAASVLRTENIQNLKEIALAFLKLDASYEIGEAFLRRVDESRDLLGFDSSNFRRICSPSEAPDAHIIYQLWGFEEIEVEYELWGFTFTKPAKDFHVAVGVRTEDGQLRWFHKFGLTDEDPREVSQEDWEEIDKNYNGAPVFFAFS